MSVQEQQETLNFQAEVKQLLHLVTHSLYSNKEIFLRELISNASDAADKLRFEALGDHALYENDAELKVWLTFDKTARTITLRDNGIGMSREEVIANLGTIAKSGTREFLARLNTDQSKDANLIGQFGVGFYSAFVVADKVEVETRRAGMNPEQGVYWSSGGEGDYLIKNIHKAQRGTTITLYLREGEADFLDAWRLRGIITKYSDHVLLPILMQKPETFVGDDKQEEAQKSEPEWEVVNRATALWTLPKNKITEDEYQQLYKHIAHDFEAPLLWSHNKVEGKLEYISLLYLPARAPFDLWNRDRKQGLKLYVHRVFIMDDAEQLLPGYLRFMRGIVDSNDLPLNVSREILQNNHVIDSIRSGCIKRTLDMLEELAKNDTETYQKFWKEFGQVLKEGIGEDHANRDKIAGLLRFSSTHDDTAEQKNSLEDYVKRMKSGQNKIYYVIADTFNAAKNSPHLEIFRKKDIEVLLLYDRVDEWLVSFLPEFSGHALQAVTKGSVDLSEVKDNDIESEEVSKKDETQFKELLDEVKKTLGDKIKDARLTSRLVNSPCCLVADEQDMSLHLQNMLKAAGQAFPDAKPIFELNSEHPLVLKMQSELGQASFQDWVLLLFEQAQLAQGTALEDPATFVKRMNELLLT